MKKADIGLSLNISLMSHIYKLRGSQCRIRKYTWFNASLWNATYELRYTQLGSSWWLVTGRKLFDYYINAKYNDNTLSIQKTYCLCDGYLNNIACIPSWYFFEWEDYIMIMLFTSEFAQLVSVSVQVHGYVLAVIRQCDMVPVIIRRLTKTQSRLDQQHLLC